MPTAADRYRDAIRQTRFSRDAPGFDTTAAIASLRTLSDEAMGETQLDRMTKGVEDYDAMDDVRRKALQPNHNAYRPKITGTEARDQRMATDTKFLADSRGFGLDPNFGVPRLLGSGNTMGQGSDAFGSTDVANARTEQASPSGQLRDKQIVDALKRMRASGY